MADTLAGESGTGARQDSITVALEGAEPIQLLWISPGTFMMGSTSENRREADERAFRVTLTRGFWMGEYEVTQGQYQAVMGDNPSQFKAAGLNAPVEQVDWFDVMEFCGRLTEQERDAGRLPEGAFFTLPTEAQWEYACRAGTTTPFSFGESLGADMANFNGNFPYGEAAKGEFRQRTLPVGTFQPNAYGLYDMHGNVREWCRDWYGAYPSGARDNPEGPLVGTERVVRGGSWFNSARFCRSAERSSNEPSFEGDLLGFRVVLVEGGE
jgi:formylglycine-generating enzyme required for sulfatase activity